MNINNGLRKSPRIKKPVVEFDLDLSYENNCATVGASESETSSKQVHSTKLKKLNESASELEDFAEVISEEPSPKQCRVTVLGQ